MIQSIPGNLLKQSMQLPGKVQEQNLWVLYGYFWLHMQCRPEQLPIQLSNLIKHTQQWNEANFKQNSHIQKPFRIRQSWQLLTSEYYEDEYYFILFGRQDSRNGEISNIYM